MGYASIQRVLLNPNDLIAYNTLETVMNEFLIAGLEGLYKVTDTRSTDQLVGSHYLSFKRLDGSPFLKKLENLAGYEFVMSSDFAKIPPRKK